MAMLFSLSIGFVFGLVYYQSYLQHKAYHCHCPGFDCLGDPNLSGRSGFMSLVPYIKEGLRVIR